MFRVSKFNGYKNFAPLKRQMSLAKRLLNATQMQSFVEARERTPSFSGSQGRNTNRPAKKTSGIDQDHGSITGSIRWPRRVFSGIQPTGSLHLGNYLGAVRKWTELQKNRESITLCIVDMHSITLPHNPPVLHENIFAMAATLLACGIDPAQSTLFVQSSVMEHAELNWILSSLSTMPRLAQLPQFKEKSRTVRDVPLGLYVYPVLQAADIMLYKATHVPVGADQLQHIQLAQQLTRTFNARYGDMFPVCTAMIQENDGSRILSLRDTSKKMSKSDPNPRSVINLTDSPDLITEKIKKALTDFTSDVSYNPSMRPGVSNLVNIHALVSNQTHGSVVEEASQLDTARYKDRVSEAVIEHLRPIREKINMHLSNRNELIYMLEMGAEKARQTAQQTMSEVKQRLGLGTSVNVPASVNIPSPLPEHSRMTASQRLAKGVLHPDANAHTQPHYDQRCEPSHAAFNPGGDSGMPSTGDLDGMGGVTVRPIMRRPTVVPVQSLRVEKTRNTGPPRHVFKMDTFNVPKIGFRAPTVGRHDQRPRNNMSFAASELGFSSSPDLSTVNSISGFKYGQNTNPSAVASVTSRVNAANKEKEMVSGLANSAYYRAAISSFSKPNPTAINATPSAAQNKNSNSNNSVINAPPPASTTSNTCADEEEQASSEEQEEEDDENTASNQHETTKAEN